MSLIQADVGEKFKTVFFEPEFEFRSEKIYFLRNASLNVDNFLIYLRGSVDVDAGENNLCYR